MIPILSAAQIRRWDEYTIAHEPVASIDLMERACRAFVEWFIQRFSSGERALVVCGTGNNGGDGLGIARLLAQKNYSVSVTIVGDATPSPDFAVNLQRLPAGVTRIDQISACDCTVIIDALFGSGLSRPVTGVYADAIEQINKADVRRVAVDIPSGLLLDEPSTGAIVQAHDTVTFQVPKLALLLPQHAPFVGEWHAVDIGLHPGFISSGEVQSNYAYVDHASAKALLRKRKKFSHKGDYGRALLVAGGYGKMGAAVLAARAALRSGTGLLTVHVPRCGYEIIQTSVPEAMAEVDSDEFHLTDLSQASAFRAIGIGPGIGINQGTQTGLRRALESGAALVLDADALNLLSENRGLLHLVPAGSILTPHPGEFERLVGSWKNDFDRLARQVALASQLKSVVVLKGAHTSVAGPDGKVYFNSTGNPGMAKGGSGDVLTGVILGLLSQGYPPLTAAVLGVYFHGRAGDLAAAEMSENALLASDIVEALGQSFVD